MVLSNAVSGTERHAAHIANFSTANENYVETFINVDNTAENDPSGTISSGHEMVSLLCSHHHASWDRTYVVLSRLSVLVLLHEVVQD
jgi:hypothetical protein